jgi:hypothetical protein
MKKIAAIKYKLLGQMKLAVDKKIIVGSMALQH